MVLPGPLSRHAADRLPTRREAFDEIVVSLVDRLTTRYGPELSDVEFGSQDVPHISAAWREPVPLGSVTGRTEERPARVVVFRRPIESKATSRSELISLVHRELVELVAELLGRSPEEIDDLADPEGFEG
jgi:predicted Zn-dependent protease with MMP-like domain